MSKASDRLLEGEFRVLRFFAPIVKVVGFVVRPIVVVLDAISRLLP
jgi:hypothetical protein